MRRELAELRLLHNAAFRRELAELRAELHQLREDVRLLRCMPRLAAQLHLANRGLREAADRLHFASCALTDDPDDED